MNIKENDNLPNSEVFILEDGEPVKKNIENLFKNKKIVIFGLPGAYTSVCSAKHLPGYVNMFEKYKEKGIDQIICISVNDPFVMNAWGKENKVGVKILMMADPFLNFTKGIPTAATATPWLSGSSVVITFCVDFERTSTLPSMRCTSAGPFAGTRTPKRVPMSRTINLGVETSNDSSDPPESIHSQPFFSTGLLSSGNETRAGPCITITAPESNRSFTVPDETCTVEPGVTTHSFASDPETKN